MAFPAITQTRITIELAQALAESPSIVETFTNGLDTYANNLTNFDLLVATVTAALFNQAAPTKLP